MNGMAMTQGAKTLSEYDRIRHIEVRCDRGSNRIALTPPYTNKGVGGQLVSSMRVQPKQFMGEIVGCERISYSWQDGG